MPQTDREAYNAYQNAYLKKKYARRKAEAVAFLGGKCVDCSRTEYLEFDHINPNSKSFNITTALAGMAEVKLYEELAKCVLRCYPCHMFKTACDKLIAVDVLGDII